MVSTSLHVTRWGQTGTKVILVHGSAQGSKTGGDTHFATQQKLADRGWQLVVPGNAVKRYAAWLHAPLVAAKSTP